MAKKRRGTNDPTNVVARDADSANLVEETDDIEEDIDTGEALDALNDDEPTTARDKIKLADEPLFAAMLRRSVAKCWPDDPVMRDYCDHVVPKLSAQLGHVSAKGGTFAAQHTAEGKQGVGRYGDDQSLRAHLVNGLLPMYRIARRLKDWKAAQLRRFDERAARLSCAGYTLHDWNKLPNVKRALKDAGYEEGKFSAATNLPLVERLFAEACTALGLDDFLQPIGGVQAVLHELIYITANTQVKWGTLHNLSLLPRLALDGSTLELCVDLSHLADLIAYVGRTPRDFVAHDGMRSALNIMSEGKASFVAHHVSEVRGVLTNLIHNAAMDALRHEAYREPILYAASGVVYLQRNDAGTPPPPAIDDVASAAIAWLNNNCRAALEQNGKGLIRGPIGIKVADFYQTYFDAPAFVRMLARHVPDKIIIDAKPSKAEERYKKIRGSNNSNLDATQLADLPADVKVDQLAEWAYACELFTRIDGESRVPDALLRILDLDDMAAAFAAVPRDNRTTGGLGLHWFFAAGHYVKRHPGLGPEEWCERLKDIADKLAQALTGATNTQADDADNPIVRDYIRETLTFVGFEAGATQRVSQAAFALELNNYSNAKRNGRGATLVSTLRSTALESDEQREAVVQFAPQVYSNKLPLHGSKALRGIDPISATEAMLRQVFMPGMNATGKNFEALKTRYLYLYPAYFFSPETLDVVKDVQDGLCNLSFTELKRQLVGERDDATGKSPEVRLDAATLQRLEELLVLPPSRRGKPNLRVVLRMDFPDDTPVTFHFLGLLPGRDPTDAESWVTPAVLALLLPLCLDVKVVASESLVPLLAESDGMSETVLLDGAHAFVRDLVEHERVNIDQVQPALARLLTACFIHLDANSKQGGTDYYQWGRIPPLARNLAQSPLYAFAYLKKWERKDKNNVVTPDKAHLYLQYAEPFKQGEHDMTIPSELTKRYRAFYRAKSFKSNGILRPLSVASKALLNADPYAFADADSLVALVRGEVAGFMSRVLNGAADGDPVKGQKPVEREAAIRAFAEYFINDVFIGAFRGDRAALQGKQLNLIKNACEVMYRDMDAEDRASRTTEGTSASAPDEADDIPNGDADSDASTDFDIEDGHR